MRSEPTGTGRISLAKKAFLNDEKDFKVASLIVIG